MIFIIMYHFIGGGKASGSAAAYCVNLASMIMPSIILS